MSRAIVTKFLGWTETKPSRIKATLKDWPKLTVTISYDHDLDDRSHQKAAQMLADKTGWGGEWLGGTLTEDSMVWVRKDSGKAFKATKGREE
jgi:hypothetical protein